jgi:hypothetical protein
VIYKIGSFVKSTTTTSSTSGIFDIMQLDKTKIVTTLAVISSSKAAIPPRLHQLQHTAQEQVKDVLECGSYDSNSLMETTPKPRMQREIVQGLSMAQRYTRSFNKQQRYGYEYSH